jgi:NitT/TauT family transport system ATP-binding protein
MKEVVVAGVAKSFAKRGESRAVLRDVSLSVGPGRFLSLVGPSGCGKSTLLKIIAGLVPRDAGEVTLGGDPVTGPRHDIGVMFQSAVLLPWRTVLENVRLPGELAGADGAATDARARALLAMVGLAGWEQYYPRELSGGMQQRAALGRVLLPEPALLLLDEPFGALDELTRENLNLALMDVLRQTGQTVVLVTHNIGEAVLMSDEVVVLAANPGRVVGRVVVDLPRPRTVSLMRLPRYAETVFEVRERLGMGG